LPPLLLPIPVVLVGVTLNASSVVVLLLSIIVAALFVPGALVL
jgi:hypothetical protein